MKIISEDKVKSMLANTQNRREEYEAQGGADTAYLDGKIAAYNEVLTAIGSDPLDGKIKVIVTFTDGSEQTIVQPTIEDVATEIADTVGGADFAIMPQTIEQVDWGGDVIKTYACHWSLALEPED
jgi:hypothetical protein